MKKRSPGGPFRFRVSDALEVPLRGWMLRLRLLEGRPALDALRPGSVVRLRPPDGLGRDIRILDFSVTSGRVTQERLEQKGELDVIVSAEDALQGPGGPVRIGWLVEPAAHSG